jgi:uncharacterized protein YfaS (alpha-2-macroglobulin family)
MRYWKQGDGAAAMRRLLCVVAAALLMLPGLNVWAQFETASVLGYVRDASGAAIPNASVTLTNTSTGISQTKTTDEEGKYEFPSVQIGNYQILATYQGFDKARTETFMVQTNARQRVDVGCAAAGH